jgi:ubiquinone/menaquinone biosynthesis C-methylase UbiE
MRIKNGKFILKVNIKVVLILGLALTCSTLWADSRDTWQQPEKVMEAIGVKPGMVIGEPGAGSGYFTLKLAHKVGPTGKIYANDIVDSCLDTIKEKSQKEGLKNIVTIKGKIEDPLFPKGELDMVFMSYVFHHLEKPVAFLKNLKPSLKPNALVVILERDPVKVPSAAGHFFYREKVLRLVKAGGYKLIRTETFLPRDNIYIFQAE